MSWLYHIIYPIIVFLGQIARLWGRWEVTGRENVPKKGPLLVIANHFHLWDVPLLGVNLGRRGSFMAKEQLFRSRFLSFLMYSLGAFPVHRGRIDTQAIRRAQKLLARGEVLIMFPEGSRSASGTLQSAFSGPALIAMRSGAPIIPVGISGTEKLKGGLAAALRRPKVRITIGLPFYPPAVNNGVKNRLTKEKRHELTKLLMQHIAELLPPEYHGSYASEESERNEN